MSQPFSPELANRLIHDKPGMTAKEIVGEALSRGIIEGTMVGQQGSLSKMLTNGKLPQVVRDETRRPYRFYPRTHRRDLPSDEPTEASDGPSPRPNFLPQVISFRPTSKQDRIVTALVLVKKAASRSEAIQWLLEQGISARLDQIEQVVAGADQIEEILREMQEPDDLKNEISSLVREVVSKPGVTESSSQDEADYPGGYRSPHLVRCKYTPHCREGLILFPSHDRSQFPGYKNRFILEADGKDLTAWVTSAASGTRSGDLAAGKYIMGGLQEWYRLRPELREGDTIIIEVLEPMRRYRLSARTNKTPE